MKGKMVCLLVVVLLSMSTLLAFGGELPQNPVNTMFKDGSRIQINSIFNSKCEVVTCKQDEYYNGISFRFDPVNPNSGYYEIYLFPDGTISYRHMFPRSPVGEYSSDGIHWRRYDYSR